MERSLVVYHIKINMPFHATLFINGKQWDDSVDQIQAMRIFIRITELGSFSRAAEDLDLPRATVSTALKNLEQRLGVRLFLRTTRQVKITEEGEQ